MIVINDHGRYFGGAQLMTGPHDGVWEATSYRISYNGNGQRDIFSAKSKILGPPPKILRHKCRFGALITLGFPLQQLHITPQLHTTPSDRHHAPPVLLNRRSNHPLPMCTKQPHRIEIEELSRRALEELQIRISGSSTSKSKAILTCIAIPSSTEMSISFKLWLYITLHICTLGPSQCSPMDELLPYRELAEAVSPPGSELLNHDGQSAAKSTAPDYRADQSMKATEGMASAPPLLGVRMGRVGPRFDPTQLESGSGWGGTSPDFPIF
ncbi:hypothetical protein PGT21_015762 [Puccinia graminis f. sp. tritici]|uniref:Uncharacterized protein n=2 Tax=Puccinia graminis f. sp. tritici TaxID=56615 RepID=A0A5B0LLY0_PUCGR|nr:hypothetical protein PGT21_015762 [Puccinia graminis f. sp. tritici]